MDRRPQRHARRVGRVAANLKKSASNRNGLHESRPPFRPPPSTGAGHLSQTRKECAAGGSTIGQHFTAQMAVHGAAGAGSHGASVRLAESRFPPRPAASSARQSGRRPMDPRTGPCAGASGLAQARRRRADQDRRSMAADHTGAGSPVGVVLRGHAPSRSGCAARRPELEAASAALRDSRWSDFREPNCRACCSIQDIRTFGYSNRSRTIRCRVDTCSANEQAAERPRTARTGSNWTEARLSLVRNERSRRVERIIRGRSPDAQSVGAACANISALFGL